MESIADLDNLYLAYYKASRGKRCKSDVVAFAKHIDENLQKIRRQLLSGDFDIGHYRYFSIFDRKIIAKCHTLAKIACILADFSQFSFHFGHKCKSKLPKCFKVE